MKSQIKRVVSNKKFYLWIVSFIVAGILLLLLVDNVIMPSYTNYNEGVTVPNVSQLALSDARDELDRHDLRYEVADRRSNEAYPADYVIDQSPAPAKIVKPDRKVYLTVNIETNPTVKVPKVADLSFRNAKIQLQNNGLEVGTISYESSRFKNSVLRQSTPPNTVVPKGSVIDLTVSDGLGETMVQVPEIKGMRLSKAQQELQQKGLRVGEIEFRPSQKVAPNVILDYEPKRPQLIEGETLKLIVSEKFGNKEESESGAIIDTSGLEDSN